MVTKKQRDEIFKALGAYQKRGAVSDLDALAKSLADESDRGMVVIVGSLIEDLLLEEIVKRLPPIEEDHLRNLTRQGGVFSGWADKVNFAHAIGIIDDRDADTLEILKSMRNACAHSRQPIDFQTDELLTMFCLMFGGDDPFAIKRLKDHGEALRATFLTAISILWGRIKGEEGLDVTGDRWQALVVQSQLRRRQQPSPKKQSKPPSQGDDEAPNP